MTAWLLVAVINCSSGTCPDAYTIAAYRTEQKCKTALRGYPLIANRNEYCVRVDQGTMAVLNVMR